MTISDLELLQLADGSLDDMAVAALRARLDIDSDASERFRAMTSAAEFLDNTEAADDTGLDELKAKILSGALDNQTGMARLMPTPGNEAASVSRRFAPLQMAAGLALLVFGLVAGYWSGSSGSKTVVAEGSDQPVWVVRVVDYHTLYGRETVASSTITSAGKVSLKQKFEDAIDGRMHIPDLASRKLDFRRGQVLSFEDKPIIQLAYLPERTGSPVALCLRPTQAPESKPVYSELHGIGVVRWTQRGLAYVMVGHRSEADLMADADKAWAEIEAAETI